MLILRCFGGERVCLDDLKFAFERSLKKIELHIDFNVVVQTLHSGEMKVLLV
jgi:hypothetical protein